MNRERYLISVLKM